MRRYLTRHDILAWARDYLTALDQSGHLAANLSRVEPATAANGGQAASSLPSQSRIASIGSAQPASSIRSWPMPGNSSGATP